MPAMTPEIKKRLFWSLLGITLFAVAMGYLEAVVVIYLRSILTRRTDWQAIEITREFATLVMLITFAFIAGSNARKRVGVFLWIFGIWDIVYYLGLKIWLNWPESLMTIDTLFYIPCTWTAPVYFPVLFSCFLILLGALLYCGTGVDLIYRSWRWGLHGWLAGCLGGTTMAIFDHLPIAASAMGLSFLCGLIAAGMGLTIAIGRRFSTVFPMIFLSIITGALSGWSGHMARSVFYTSTLSPLWTMGLATGLNLLVSTIGRARRRTCVPCSNTDKLMG